MMEKADMQRLTGMLGKEFKKLNTERFGDEIEDYKLKFSNYSARTHGRISFQKKEIMISLPLFEQYGWEAVSQTLLHEMVHALIHQRGGHNRHTKRFWEEFRRRGGVRDRLEVKPRAAYVYACPTCDAEFERMRRIKRPWLYSCSFCSRGYNPLHRLYLKRDKYQTSLKAQKE